MFRRTLFIRTKHNLQIWGVIPFLKLQNDLFQIFVIIQCSTSAWWEARTNQILTAAES